MKKILFFFGALSLTGCSNNTSDKATDPIAQQADTFLLRYNKLYREYYYKSGEAQWKSNTRIVEGDSTNAIATRKAEEENAAFTGSIYNIEAARHYLQSEKSLSNIQIKQLKAILYKAANNPATVSETVKARIKAETAQTEKLFGFNFTIDKKPVSTNDIDNILKSESSLEKRKKAWVSSKEVGKGLKDGLANLRDLRNATVKSLGYANYFEYQVSDYGMKADEMTSLLKKINQELFPLYRELHTYARYELAARFGVKEVPDMIPAHWLSNRWGQDWSEMVEVKGLNLDSVIKSREPEWIIKQAERYYMSMGFPELPASFYEKSDLYPAPPGAKYRKNNHASAWHVDLDKDVRSLMSIIPNTEWYETTHHELGHIYYYMTYSRPEIPYILREGANRAYHEALGSLFGFAAMQRPFLSGLNLLPANASTDKQAELLKEALNFVVFIPFSTGTMSMFEHELYAGNLPKEEFNKKWWDLVRKYQGIEPPEQRGEEYCDAATKTHINDDAAQYYDYALSYILLFQFHDHISKNILKQDPHETNYYGNKAIGSFISDMMKSGSSGDWRKILKEKTGSELSAKAMLDYFNPIMDFLKKANEGRKYTMEMPE